MSYSAFVVCRCYQDGKTVQPPHKEYIHFDADGLYLDIPNEIMDKDKERGYKMYSEFDDWKFSSCEHEDMELCNEYLSNNWGMADFRSVIAKEGGEKVFPILTKYLPKANGGILPSEFAQDMLDELNKLENTDSLQELAVLREKSTQLLLASIDSTESFTFVLTAYNKNHAIIDGDGFIITENKEAEDGELIRYVVFRSKHFTQQRISEKWFCFTDIDTGEKYECSINLLSDDNEDIRSFEFEVSLEKVRISEKYDYIIKPLKKLALASIETGNPIHWC